MFWLMDSKLEIGDRSNERLMNARTWPARKGSMEGMTDGTWHCHRMDHKAKRTRIYVLLKFWQDYISNKTSRRDNMPPNALAIPKTVFSHAMTVMDKVEGWNEDR